MVNSSGYVMYFNYLVVQLCTYTNNIYNLRYNCNNLNHELAPATKKAKKI